MSELVGFGSPLVTTLWALACIIAFAWLGRQIALGRFITIPTYIVMLSFVAPLLIQYPFTFSPLNVLATGADAFAIYPAYIDRVFVISLAGMLSVVLGFLAPIRVSDHFAPASFVHAGIRIWAQSAFLYISSFFIITLFIAMAFLGLLGVGGAREQAMMAPALRPLVNLAYSLLPLVVALTLAVGWQRRRPFILLLAIVNLSLAVLIGTRSAVLSGILWFAVAALCRRSLSTGLSVSMTLRVVGFLGVLLIVTVYLGDVRRGQYNPVLSVLGIGAKLFYGNNFSDLRDFTWVRAYWDGHYFWGKTELAGLLSFVPSVISPFRSHWNWGVVSTQLTGLDSELHPGLRPGIFGELYFNFGVPGVITGGLLYGYVARRLHAVTRRAATSPDIHAATLEILAAFVTLGLFGSFLLTAGFFGFYLVVLTLVVVQVVAFVARAGSASNRSAVQGPAGIAYPPVDS